MTEQATATTATEVRTASRRTGRDSVSSGFTAEERAAMKERASETRRSKSADGEQDLLAKVAEMPTDDRELAEKLHALVRATAPELTSRTWYGMPAYAKDGSVLMFFQSASKFSSRYATIGFTDKATLDDGDLWPTYFGVTSWTPAVEKKITALVKRAVRG